MTAFNDVFYLESPKFATESTRTPLRELTIKKKNWNLAPRNWSKYYAISRSQNQKRARCPDPSLGGEGNTPSPHPSPFGASPQSWTRVDARFGGVATMHPKTRVYITY